MNPALLAQTLTTDTTYGSVNWLYQFTNNLTDLTTQHADVLTSLGTTELSFIALLMLVGLVMEWNFRGMAIGGYHHPLHVGDLMRFFRTLLICSLMETYWTTPMPGASFGLAHLFAYLAQVIVTAFDQNSLNTLTQLLNDASQNTPMPSGFAVAEHICYWLVELMMALASGILFYLNCSSFIMYGVTSLFGPLFIPLMMVPSLRGMFLSFMQTLLSFGMIRAVAGGYIFIWSGFLMAFMQRVFNGNYSIAMWEANWVGVGAVFVAFFVSLAGVMKLTQDIFGGSASSASGLGSLMNKVM
ncbi:type IV secretion system protein [Acidipila sp. EB88]|uniref:type IV secretion system protein n=1 Tax=Acidipila sp. EB88 TaxID=2305226 RepID=UPI000F5DA839|nr:type IV secretion system protein [Acidipila sp. EB88]RRA50453.1 hypothetical protein D1Y84_00115 [Acidipila sp. EB88]